MFKRVMFLTFNLSLLLLLVGCKTSKIEVIAKNESIHLSWNDKDDEDTVVEYKNRTDEEYETIDSELIRFSDDNTLVADIVGIPEGTYDVRVTTSEGKKLTKEKIKVDAIDRSGYAHFEYTNGVGAYTDNGELKPNTQVIYVSNDNKNSVEFSNGSEKYKGIGNILQNVKYIHNPVAIRILDEITCAQFKAKKFTPRLESNHMTQSEIDNYFSNTLESSDVIHNITNRIKISNQTTVYNGNIYYDDDSYFNMMDVEDAKNVTIEGIGTSAILKQWGFTFKRCNSIEVRNLTFSDYPEDACSFEGATGNESLYGNYFIHHNTFNIGKNNWDLTVEQDKPAGDGATDIKYCHNVTVAYNNYNKCKKTGLVGGSDSNLQWNMTFHHNYYNEVNSRLPLGRQANMHMYNNYYYKTNSNLDLRANAYAFTEGNYFESVGNPGKIKGGAAIKSWNDVYDNVKGDNKSIKVTSRTEVVTNNCTYGTDFDTNSNLFYYDNEKKETKVSYITSAEQAKIDCPKMAGVLKAS